MIGFTVVKLTRELDLASCDELRRFLIREVGRGHHHLIVDLSDLTFMDRSGLAVLVACEQRARQHGGWLRVNAAHGAALLLLRLTGTDAILGRVTPGETAQPGTASHPNGRRVRRADHTRGRRRPRARVRTHGAARGSLRGRRLVRRPPR